MRAERALGAEPGSTHRDAPGGAAAIAEAERLFGLEAGDLSRRTPKLRRLQPQLWWPQPPDRPRAAAGC